MITPADALQATYRDPAAGTEIIDAVLAHRFTRPVVREVSRTAQTSVDHGLPALAVIQLRSTPPITVGVPA